MEGNRGQRGLPERPVRLQGQGALRGIERHPDGEVRQGEGDPPYRCSIYDEARYFLAGLNGGKSWHFTTYSASGLSIELSVRAKDSDTGYWVLIYNNTELAKGYDKAKANREKSAL